MVPDFAIALRARKFPGFLETVPRSGNGAQAPITGPLYHGVIYIFWN